MFDYHCETCQALYGAVGAAAECCGGNIAQIPTLRSEGDLATHNAAAQQSIPAPKAAELLGRAAKHMYDRAATYDKPEGERSMGRTVDAFNAVTGHTLKESEGWLFMALLKAVRSETRSEPHQDSLEDLIAYTALYAEARGEGK